jgi:hypothetical protein
MKLSKSIPDIGIFRLIEFLKSQSRYIWFTPQFVWKVVLESSTNALLAEARASFEVLMPTHLEHIVFHGTFETLDAIESLLHRNTSGAYLRFGDGEARSTPPISSHFRDENAIVHSRSRDDPACFGVGA